MIHMERCMAGELAGGVSPVNGEGDADDEAGAGPTWAKLVRTLAVEFGQDGAFVVG
jgi:hypothetical protein